MIYYVTGLFLPLLIGIYALFKDVHKSRNIYVHLSYYGMVVIIIGSYICFFNKFIGD